MDLFWNGLAEIFWMIGWAGRWLFRWGVWLLSGKFIPDICLWCRTFWMLGIAGVVIFTVWHIKGPRSD